MNFEVISIIVFLIILGFLVILHRKKMQLQKVAFPLIYILIWRTQLGIKWMQHFADRFKKPLKYIGYFSIFIGFVGMILIGYALIRSLIDIILKPSAIAGVGLVLPIKAKGVFYVPFFYWIISIFILAIVHEFSHGVFVKWTKLKVKSSGFAVLSLLVPMIPAAFVEPDEKAIVKKSKRDQLMIYSAGPFANIVLAFLVVLVMLFVFAPITNNIYDNNGVLISSVVEGDYPAFNSGIVAGEVINSIDGAKISDTSDFSYYLNSKKPEEIISIETDKNEYEVTLAENPDDSSKTYLGVYVEQSRNVDPAFKEKYGKYTPEIITWIIGLFYWLYVLNLGIGLFNLVPLGPLDGGRMLLVGLERFFSKEVSRKIWKFISLFFFILIITNIAFSFIR